MQCAVIRRGGTVTLTNDQRAGQDVQGTVTNFRKPVARCIRLSWESMNEDDFSRLPPGSQVYIRELESRNRQLGERIAQLDERPGGHPNSSGYGQFKPISADIDMAAIARPNLRTALTYFAVTSRHVVPVP